MVFITNRLNSLCYFSGAILPGRASIRPSEDDIQLLKESNLVQYWTDHQVMFFQILVDVRRDFPTPANNMQKHLVKESTTIYTVNVFS